MIEIVFLKLKNNKCPVEEFLDSLTPKIAQKVTWVLKIIQEGQIVPRKYFKKLTNTNDIWECRIAFSTDSVRILAFFDKKNRLVLTHGFMKKTQKTPKEEITKAEKFREYFLKGDI